MLRIKDECNLTDEAFKKIMKVFDHNESSLYSVKKTLKKLVPFDASYVDICVNSCCAYTGPFDKNVSCPYCGEDRYQMLQNRERKPRKQASYFSLVERLKIQYSCHERSKEMMYRKEYTSSIEYVTEETIGDVFDGAIYKNLVAGGFFQDHRDIALSASIDGYQIFKQRNEENWIVLFLNNNLPPNVRVKKENLMIAAMFPGPKAPKDFNSFMEPIVKELKLLEGKESIIIAVIIKKKYY